MSNLTTNDVNNLMLAYQAVYDPDIRYELEEEKEIEEVGIQIIENAAYVLFSQGYDVNDLIDYFTEADVYTISEDAIAISEGILLVESVGVSDEYIEEQFEILYENPFVSALRFGGKLISGAGKVLSGAGKKGEAIARARNIQSIRNAKNIIPPGSARVTSDSGRTALRLPARVTTSGGKVTGNLFQKAAGWAKGTLGKIPGAKVLGKLGGKALPVAGAALYGMDAANRFKKGDWGGGLLSGAGAVTSLIPGVGLVAGLAPAGIQMATDAMGLTGDRSLRKGKPAPSGAPKPKGGAGMVDIPGRGSRYYSSSDRKYYKNYNDALAARNSRRGVTSTPTPPSSSPSTPSSPSSPSGSGSRPSTPSTSPTPSRTSGGQSTDMDANYRAWAKANPTLAGKVKPGQAGYDAINRPTTPPSTTTAPEVRATNAAAANPNTGTTALRPPGSPPTPTEASTEEERRRKEREAAATRSESYEPFDIVLDYLFSEGHTDTLDEALYVMMEMDYETIRSICEK